MSGAEQANGGGPGQAGPPLELGLPATWAPVPITWHLAKLAVVGPTGPATLHVLMVDGPTGRVAFGFPTDDLARLRDQLTEQVSGLTVAGSIPATNGHRH